MVVVGAWLSPACGGDSESDDNTTGGSGGGGTGGTEAGTDTGTGGTTTGGSGGTGGTTTGCVAANCPGFQGFVAGCCLPDDTCGYDGSQFSLGCVSQSDIESLLDGGLDAAVPPDAADPNCPSYKVAGYDVVGCCPSTGFCGVYDPFLNKKCVDWSEVPFQFDSGAPKPCGDAAAGDSGSDAAADAPSDAGSTDASSD